MNDNDKQVFEKLISLCNNHKDGFTANKNAELLNLNSGFAVSLTNNKEKNLKNLVKKVMLLADAFKEIDFKIGGWQDIQNKEFYLDISLILPDLSNALNLGRLFNQKAIFDFKNLSTIQIQN